VKILVTGATGFVGSHLCDLLHSQGHEVFALVRSPNKAKEFNTPGTYISGSLSSDRKNNWVQELPSDLDAVVHTAGIVHSMNVEDFYKVNSTCTKRLILDLKDRYKNLKFTLISSLAASGPSSLDNSLTELSTDSPVSEYGKSKLLAEEYTKELSPNDWSINIIRPPMVIGPRDSAVLDVFKMINKSFVVTAGLNGQSNKYSFICVYDLVDCVAKTLNSDNKECELYFGSYPLEITLEELYDELKVAMNKSYVFNLKIPAPLIRLIGNLVGLLSKVITIDIRLTPDKVNELLPSTWVCESTKSQKKLNMNYSWDLKRTIKETLEDYKSRGWI
jgi:nucleoside-diphosphate-sugar epimerase